MYIFSEYFNERDIGRGVVRRNIELLQRIAHEFFWPGERYNLCSDDDGLGVWVVVDSTSRPEELLKDSVPDVRFPWRELRRSKILDALSRRLNLSW
jgi:hypothetical protein